MRIFYRDFIVLGWIVCAGLGVSGLQAAEPAASPAKGANAPATPPNAATNTISDSLQNAIIEAKKKLGELDEVQNKLFDEEAVPQYQRFIKDYRSTGSGVSAEVDLDTLKKYLAYRSAPSMKRKFTVALYSEKGCAACAESLPAIKKLITERLERRGYFPRWAGPEDLGNPGLSGKALEEKAADASRQKSDSGVLVLQWKQAPVDVEDAVHADEKHFILQSFIWADQTKYEGQLEIGAEDSFETAAAKLLAESFTALGAGKLASTTAVEEISDSDDELLLEISGLRDFNQYKKLKEKLMATVPAMRGLPPVEDRKIARGQVVFSMHSTKKSDELKPILTGLSLDPGALALVDSSSHLIKMEIR
jgi:hypothetical protein